MVGIFIAGVAAAKIFGSCTGYIARYIGIKTGFKGIDVSGGRAGNSFRSLGAGSYVTAFVLGSISTSSGSFGTCSTG